VTSVNECLILAAGNGSRIASLSGSMPKPLVSLFGVSALAAKEFLRNPFLLLMADHIFEPRTARALLRQPLGEDEVILGVDYNIERIFDLDDATKVRVQGSDIVDIGKDLADYGALDTGMFLCGPALFERLESAKKNGNCSLSDGMRRLGQERKLKAFDIGGGHWQDVDTPEAFAYTESIFERDFSESPILQRFAYV
jgi:1L-myo-inositol 1-phosphate cytidylyltransferase